ncbi:MAG: LysR substrate-binding domain-containing protein [Solirubrobacterales bacterium]
MTLKQLRYFLAIVDEGSITKAAERLHIAQPSLSQQLRALEDTLGGTLIERSPRFIRLTALGRQIQPHARAAVRAAENVEGVARTILTASSGELEIATVRSIASGILPASITEWRSQHPQATVRLHEFGHRAILEERVRDGLADLAVGPSPLNWRGPTIALGWEEFVVILPPTDPLGSGGEPISLDALRDREWVLFEPKHGLSEFVSFACSVAGFTPTPALQTADVEAAARLAAAGLGPALVPADAVPSSLDAVALPLDPPLGRDLAAYTRDRFTPLANSYLEVLRRDERWQPRPAQPIRVP